MIDSHDALQLVLKHSMTMGAISVDLLSSIDAVLAEDIVADRDFPPFDRVTMDGIAIAFEAFANGCKTFPVEAIAAAGNPQLVLQHQEHCIEIMTGAILPKATDTIIRYEDLKKSDNGYEITTDVKQGQNVHKKGRDHREGELLLSKGSKIKAIDINVLANVGKQQVKVLKMPSIAVISSGDELVDINEAPKEYQIRKSNVYMIQAALAQMGAESSAYHCTDNKQELIVRLQKIMNDHDVLLLSGGVSKGKYDFIPDVLESIGVKKHFHRVAQKPGKPFWFGTMDNKTIFAFPGNPVSTLLCFLKYFRPWLSQSLTGQVPKCQYVELAEDFTFKPDLTYFAQATISQNSQGKLVAIIEQGNGSGDMVNPTRMDGFVELPRGQALFKKGELYPFISFDLVGSY